MQIVWDVLLVVLKKKANKILHQDYVFTVYVAKTTAWSPN